MGQRYPNPRLIKALWAQERSKQTHELRDGIAAGKAYAAFLEAFTIPESADVIAFDHRPDRGLQ